LSALGVYYFYRVLEAYFDDVLRGKLEAWRRDPTLDELKLLSP
jgi:hypothetical protein